MDAMLDQGLEEAQSQEQPTEAAEQEESGIMDLLADQGLDEEQSEEEPATFMSEDEVPEELKPQWREMNKKFTRTQQELARLRKELESALQSVRGAQPQETAQTSAGLGTGNPAVDNDPVLNWLAQQYQEAIQDGDMTTAQRIGAEFQNRLQLLTVQSELTTLKNELVSAKVEPQLREVRNNPFFSAVWTKEAEAKIKERIAKGDSPEEAAWAVLGPKAAAKAALKAYEEARKKKEVSEKASTPAGTPSSPAAHITDLPPDAIMHGDRPSIAKIWQKIKELGGVK
jgi:hypothetical protein